MIKNKNLKKINKNIDTFVESATPFWAINTTLRKLGYQITLKLPQSLFDSINIDELTPEELKEFNRIKKENE